MIQTKLEFKKITTLTQLNSSFIESMSLSGNSVCVKVKGNSKEYFYYISRDTKNELLRLCREGKNISQFYNLRIKPNLYSTVVPASMGL